MSLAGDVIIIIVTPTSNCTNNPTSSFIHSINECFQLNSLRQLFHYNRPTNQLIKQDNKTDSSSFVTNRCCCLCCPLLFFIVHRHLTRPNHSKSYILSMRHQVSLTRRLFFINSFISFPSSFWS